jgi:hypothetical protein
MAEKRYKITAAVAASPNYAALSQYTFRTGFEHGTGSPLQICQCARCPSITCDATDVLGTTNEWAQRCMEAAMIPKGLKVDGVDYMGTPGAAVFEETTDPVTIDLDPFFNP